MANVKYDSGMIQQLKNGQSLLVQRLQMMASGFSKTLTIDKFSQHQSRQSCLFAGSFLALHNSLASNFFGRYVLTDGRGITYAVRNRKPFPTAKRAIVPACGFEARTTKIRQLQVKTLCRVTYYLSMPLSLASVRFVTFPVASH
jgi:hypothetical protein